jgi:mannose-6-phosphate isomerase-like protein (cupin superfamily)
MHAFALAQLGERRQAAAQTYLEFVRVPALSLGLYELPAGGTDPQKPHTEDEVYWVTSGRATVTVADEEQAVAPGSVTYVAAGVPHRFHSIAEDLTLLVFFAPAVYSQAKG